MKLKQFYFISLLALLMASCQAPRLGYFQDVQSGQVQQLQPPKLVTVQPGDKLSILVGSKDPGLAYLFNLNIVGRYRTSQSEANLTTNQVASYTVDEMGEIDFPVMGKLMIKGMTRREVSDYIKNQLISRSLLKDPVVTVDFLDMTYSVLGEVNNPGRFLMDHDKTTLIDALSRAYNAVWLINDIATGSFSLFRGDTSEGSVHARPTKEALELLTYEDAKANYINNFVAPSDRERLEKELTLENIIANTTSKKVFGVVFKRVVGDKECYYRIEFAQVQLPNGKTGIVAGFKDVDEDVRKEQEIQQVLRDAIDTANATSKAKSDFLSSMSHDIRTPMNGIIGMTAIATAHLDDRERVEDCLKKISEASSHLLSLINEVLDMNKIESGKVELNEENFNLSELVDTLLAMTKAQLESHHHTLKLDVADVVHENVIGDSHRIQQVFVNLMSNAIKYTPDGGTISLTVAERPTNAHGVACYEFVFEDNGIGMTEDFQKHLFEPFTRANDKKTAAIQGTGLGMTITQSLVRMMGGDIQVKSKPGEGSRFAVTIYLKFLDVQNAEARKEDPLKNLEDLKFEGKRILLVEDHPVNAEIAKNVLQMTGLEVEWVMDGEAAVERMAGSNEGEFDLVFMDIQMPNMDSPSWR